MNLNLSNDKDFLGELTKIVLANLGNENFGVKELIRESGLNDRNIRKRIKTLTHRTIHQFITELRLQKALEMLQQCEITASEAAFRTGFGSPAYFNTSFHRHYGFPPGEARKRYISQLQQENPGENGNIPSPGHIPLADIRKKSRIQQYRFLILAGVTVFLVLTGIIWLNKISLDRSIVVLPFKNFTPSIENEHFANGITEDILDNLYEVGDLEVRSRTTSDHFRGTTLTASEIARKVKARNVLEGSIRQEGNKIRISVQLIDASKDKHLWSEKYDCELGNVLGIQGEIALQVARKLKAVLSQKEISRIEAIPTRSPEAYKLYLRGRFLLNKANSEQRFDIDREGLLSSIQYFRKATEADSSFALAWAGLATAWFNISAWGWYQPYAEGIQNAWKFSARALEIDPECAVAQTIKGAILIWPQRKFDEGKQELQKALRMDPNYPFANQAYAQLLMSTGPVSEAREHMDRAVELEPYFWVIQNLNAWIYYFEEKYDKSIEACRIARDLYKNYIQNNWLSFLNFARLGEGEKAAAELVTLLEKNPASKPFATEIPEVYKKSGIPGLFNWLIDINLHRPVRALAMSGQPFFVAWWYAILGDRENSMLYLEKNMETVDRAYFFLNLMATNPDFDLLRGNPRFKKMMKEIGLAAYDIRKAR